MSVKMQNNWGFSRVFFLCIFLSVYCLAYAKEDTGKSEMNGYTFKEYEGFWKTWHLVTVRYRKDNDELRFVYANNSAWKVLQEGKSNFPDGAILGKVAFHAGADPLFESSRVPLQVSRYQLMVKDSARHADTRGWGYAIFDHTGKALPGNPKQIAQACAACHELAASRGYVFSLTMNSNPLKKMSNPHRGDGNSIETLIKFEEKPRHVFPVLEKDLPKPFKMVRIIAGPLRKNLFEGTLSEIWPTLIKEAMRSKQPAALVSEDQAYWSLVYPSPKNERCWDNNRKPGMQMVLVMKAVYSSDKKVSGGDIPKYRKSWCEPFP